MEVRGYEFDRDESQFEGLHWLVLGLRVCGQKFGVHGLQFRVWDSGDRLQFHVQPLAARQKISIPPWPKSTLRVAGFGSRVDSLRLRFLRFRIWGLELRVEGSGFGV